MCRRQAHHISLSNHQVRRRNLCNALTAATLAHELSLDTPVSETTPTLMAYAYARFRSDQGPRLSTRRSPPDYFRALPRLFRWYWRASRVMPNWLFRRSFAFVYGQTRTKRVVARILSSSRCNFRERKRLFERIECTRPPSIEFESEVLD